MAVAAAYTWRGNTGLEGMVLGLLGASANLGFGWWGIQSAGKSMAGRQGNLANLFVVFALLMKLPIIVGCGMIAWRIGGSASGCFLAGVGLVYSALFGWALVRQ